MTGPYPPHQQRPHPSQYPGQQGYAPYPGQQRYSPPGPYGAIPAQRPAEPAKPRRRPVGIIFAAVAALVVLAGVGLAIGSAQPNGPSRSNIQGGAPVLATADEGIAIPNVVGMSGNQAQEALNAAGLINVNFPQNTSGPGIPLQQLVTQQSPAAGERRMPGDPVMLTLQELPPAPPREISSRDWAVIAKSPDAHQGERLIVFGKVTQFDSVTGTSAFRANIDGERQSKDYEYDVNTILRGDPAVLADIVADDVFRAEVTVIGSYSYETTIGGTLTVPQLQVDSISRL